MSVGMKFAASNDKRVLIRCINNRTSSPIGIYSSYDEAEVLSRSDTEWVVLGNVMMDELRIINVIERRK